MPRFSEKEKQAIRSRLFTKGTQLFLQYGISKVTIDDITSAVGIAKASFYKFYENKENLYLDIILQEQAQLFSALDVLLSENGQLPAKDRVREVFAQMYRLLSEYPLLASVDADTAQLIARRVPENRLAALQAQSQGLTAALHRHGIRFLYDDETVNKVFQALYQAWLSLLPEDASLRQRVTDLMLEGIL